MRRRMACLLAGLLGFAPWTVGARAAAAPRPGPVRIGRISEGGPGDFTVFRAAMRSLGYPDVHIEDRPAKGDAARLPALAAELAVLGVDLIWSTGTVATAAAHGATRSVPIVMVSADPIRAGLVTDLARPGGNLTGLSLVSADLAKKRIEFLVELDPRVRRVVALTTGPDSMTVPFVVEWLRESRAAAGALHIALDFVELAPDPATWDGAFASLAGTRGTALAFVESPYLLQHAPRIAEMATKHRLPAVYAFQTHVDAGGLMSYGVTAAHIAERVAHYVARILGGAKPGDLPVEQPTKLELAINLRAAKALGLAVPAALRLRADRIVE